MGRVIGSYALEPSQLHFITYALNHTHMPQAPDRDRQKSLTTTASPTPVSNPYRSRKLQ